MVEGTVRFLLQWVDSISAVCCMLMTFPGSLTYAMQGALAAAQLLLHQLLEGRGGCKHQTLSSVCGWGGSAADGPACTAACKLSSLNP